MSDILNLTEEVRDMPCSRCQEALMKLKFSHRYRRWFYGCPKYPNCRNTFDAHQITGAPLPGQDGRYQSSEWTSGHPEEFTHKTRLPGRAFWRHLLDDTYMSEPLEVMPEAFPDNVTVHPRSPIPRTPKAVKKAAPSRQRRPLVDTWPPDSDDF